MSLDYTATINLLPQTVLDDEELEEFAIRVGLHSLGHFRTTAYSVDDAIGLVQAAKPASRILAWNLNLRPDEDIAKLEEAGINLEYRHLPGYAPHVVDVVNDLPSNGEYRVRPVTEIYFSVIHHSVSYWLDTTTLENARRMANFHVSSRGWPRIGYHYVIGAKGDILQTNYLESSSYHAGSFSAPGDENFTALGICLLGDFRYAPPPEPQYAAASALVKYLQDTLYAPLAVVPHKRMPGASTACPGYRFGDWLRVVDGSIEWI